MGVVRVTPVLRFVRYEFLGTVAHAPGVSFVKVIFRLLHLTKVVKV